MLSRILVASLCLTSLTALAQSPNEGQGYSQAPMVDASDDEDLPESQPGQNFESTQQFVQPLAPYGSWVSDEGVTAFQPSPQVVGSDFTPYASQGQWAATTAGWEFQSSLPFSWATYHYGRWYFSPRYGWVWVPDTQWAPSWVEWRSGGGYAGWSPLAPQYVSSSYQPRWFFVESCNLRNANVYRYGIDRSRAWGLTASLPSRGGWHVGPSYGEWRSHSAPQVTVQFGGNSNRGPFPPSYDHGEYRGGWNGGGYHPSALPPPPPSYNNGGGSHGGAFGGGYHASVPPPPPSSYGSHEGGFGGGYHASVPPPPPSSHGGGSHGGNEGGHGGGFRGRR